MDGEANLPPATAPASTRTSTAIRPINPDSNFSRSFTSTSSSSSSSFSTSPPEFLRNVQAAFKRHRPLGTMQSNATRPRRLLVAQREVSKTSTSNVDCTKHTETTQDEGQLGQRMSGSVVKEKNTVSVVGETQEDPSILGSTNAYEKSFQPDDVPRDQLRSVAVCQNNDIVSSLRLESQPHPQVDGKKKVEFSLGNNATSQEIDWESSSQMEVSTAISHDLKQQNFQSMEVDISLRSDCGVSSLLEKKSLGLEDRWHEFRSFVRSDFGHPKTQSSNVESSCATTTAVNSVSAPMINSTTFCSQPHQSSGSCVALESPEVGDMVQPVDRPSPDHINGIAADQTAIPSKVPSSTVNTKLEVKETDLSKEQQNDMPKQYENLEDPVHGNDKLIGGKGFAGDVANVESQIPSTGNLLEDVKREPSKSGKQEKATSGKTTSAPRKKTYDADTFFKVNGKLYQRLGKIGSGGSSEVHKVISSDCAIYALKRIKLKGRDYATAFGFCQEIEYLNKLKGKTNIIQLIDYEVTDKNLLQEVMNGTMSNKDARVKDDGFIYMVLEFGEIDLAHMLSQKWKEIDGSKSSIDENWLRFYWQQILLAVKTIHEERIVHSDLKPANFLLVRGSLKLIDFGIAKAIMSDTTNIQRDSQVGTLSYMSPEAFMCNEIDANGNTIKCGRPSDIWSLGCILYQMVYGRTPFAEYKTFWAKFKVITDPNHEIAYEPVSNPWLLDLMKKCLAWDRNERWRIPQLLQHPFLVPPIPKIPSSPQEEDHQSCKLVQLISESCVDDPRALTLCCQLQQLLRGDPRPAAIKSKEPENMLREVSNLCIQLQEHLAKLDRD